MQPATASSAPAEIRLAVLDGAIRLVGDPAPFRARLTSRAVEPGLVEVVLELSADAPAVPPPMTLVLARPLVDAAIFWSSAAGREKRIGTDWSPSRVNASATLEAPVVCVIGADGGSRLCLALDDALDPCELAVGAVEETGMLDARVRLFPTPRPAATAFRSVLRLDARAQRYEQALAAVAAWWAAMPGYAPCAVPDLGRLPMYSTWYSFHQSLDVDAVVRECVVAKGMGCEAVIVDDGWQTLDGNRGYAFCGDWLPERIADMRGFVDRVHGAGLKFLLWYSVPFVGEKSAAWARFSGKLLRRIPSLGCGVLDPRHPDVREYLIQTYERAMRDWDLDGFKLDFVDNFAPTAEMAIGAVDGRDIASVSAAADVLLASVLERLRAINPDVLIEFRQSYTGPLMRRYGNLFRAGDCPADHVRNRLASIDVRLLAGRTAVHGDMLMWHVDDPVESAALQLLAVLFAVPQISVLLERVPQAHRAMLTHWLGFWRAHRACLLDGELRAQSPELNYPLVAATNADEHIAAAYADVVVAVADRAVIAVVNATRGARLVIETPDLGERRVRVSDCQGRVVRDARVRLGSGVHRMDVPAAGSITIER
ncbi:MAG TPA: glycoside hydrolase family 36 protein [Planctomycetota bacterium]|nr:glycoside hydrolase family 36 protein [Planctomycetota bacterium]